MEERLIKTRKFNKETYKVYLCTPTYNGETGYLGVEIEPYVVVETPQNSFGYEDYVHFNSIGYGYCLHRTLPNWIMRELEKINRDILRKFKEEHGYED